MKEKNIRIKTDTGYVWDLNRTKRLAQIVKRNEEEANRLEKTAGLKLIIAQYVERDDVMGLAEFFRAYIEDELLEKLNEAKEITVKVSNIGLLRQFINELPEGKMVTDEDIIKFLK